RLLESDSNAMYASSGREDGSGFLLFAREGALLAQTFTPTTLKTTGEPFPVAARVGRELDFSRASFSVSDNGVLIFDPSTKRQNKRLVWVDRSGTQVRALDAGAWGRPWLSPDEKRVAVDRAESDTGVRDIWLYDTATGAPSRFTFDPGDDIYPVWSPDG